MEYNSPFPHLPQPFLIPQAIAERLAQLIVDLENHSHKFSMDWWLGKAYQNRKLGMTPKERHQLHQEILRKGLKYDCPRCIAGSLWLRYGRANLDPSSARVLLGHDNDNLDDLDAAYVVEECLFYLDGWPSKLRQAYRKCHSAKVKARVAIQVIDAFLACTIVDPR